MSQPRAVGIDVSAKTLHVACEGRDTVAEFENNHIGFKKLTKFITKGSPREVRVVLEATGSYHLDLAVHLVGQKKCSVMVANPRVTKAFHEAHGGRAKTDKVDARSLMAFAQRMEFVPWKRPSQDALELRAAGRYVDQLVKERTRLQNQLHAVSSTETTPTWVLQGFEKRIADATRLEKEAKARLVQMAKAMPATAKAVELLTTLPGIGEETAAQLISEFLFLDRSMTSKQIAAWSGLDPRPRESGTSMKRRRAMSKRGNARIRRMMYMSALTAGRVKGPFMDLKLRVTERRGKKMIGVGAVMRKLLIVAWAIYRTEQPYDPSKSAPRQSGTKIAA